MDGRDHPANKRNYCREGFLNAMRQISARDENARPLILTYEKNRSILNLYIYTRSEAPISVGVNLYKTTIYVSFQTQNAHYYRNFFSVRIYSLQQKF